MKVYVVIYSKYGEPCVFKDHKTAYDFMIEITAGEMNRRGYNYQELVETLIELQKTYRNNKNFFGTNWLDTDIYCYECEIL